MFTAVVARVEVIRALKKLVDKAILTEDPDDWFRDDQVNCRKAIQAINHALGDDKPPTRDGTVGALLDGLLADDEEDGDDLHHDDVAPTVRRQ
jgi:hypothetical protein